MHRLARSGGGIGPARECRHQRGGTRVLEGKPSPWKQRARWFWQRSPRATDSLVEQGLWTAQRRDGSPSSRCRLARLPASAEGAARVAGPGSEAVGDVLATARNDRREAPSHTRSPDGGRAGPPVSTGSPGRHAARDDATRQLARGVCWLTRCCRGTSCGGATCSSTASAPSARRLAWRVWRTDLSSRWVARDRGARGFGRRHTEVAVFRRRNAEGGPGRESVDARSRGVAGDGGASDVMTVSG